MLQNKNTMGAPDASRPPSLTNRYLQKRAISCLILLLAATTVYDTARPNTKVDVSKINALVAEAYQQSRTERGLQLVVGSLHEPSNPSRKCQAASVTPIPFHGTATLTLKDNTRVEMTINDCHPCTWPTKPGEDISAYVQLDVKSSDNQSFSIMSYIGGFDEHSTGSFTIELPVNIQARSRILQLIHQIALHDTSAKRETYNVVLEEVLSSLHNSISNPHALRLGALLCKSIDLSLNSDNSP